MSEENPTETDPKAPISLDEQSLAKVIKGVAAELKKGQSTSDGKLIKKG